MGNGGRHWVIRVGWEVARIQAGATNSGVPSPRCHKRSWPRRYQSAPLSVSLLDRWCLPNLGGMEGKPAGWVLGPCTLFG